jgi:acetyltransferase
MLGGFHKRFSENILPSELAVADAIASHAKVHAKPVVVQSLYMTDKPEPLLRLREAGVPVCIWVEPAVQAIRALADYGDACRRLENAEEQSDQLPLIGAEKIFEKAYAQKRPALFENEAKDLLRLYGLQVPSEVILKSEAELENLPQDMRDEPLAMKIVSQDILHKSDAGGVKLNVLGPEARKTAYLEILANAKAYKPGAEIEGVLATPMLKSGVEIILGVTRDETFGPVLMFGLGGIMVEVLKDVTFRSIPLSWEDAASMLTDIKAAEILDGVRGAKPVDKEALIDLIVKLSDMVWKHPQIVELDLNPVIAREDGVSIADARIILSEEN